MGNYDLGIVLSAGAAAAFNPCGIALLPSFIAYLIGAKEGNWIKGIQAGVLMTLGFITVFLPMGLITVIFRGLIQGYMSYVVTLVGVFLVITGWYMYSGKELFKVKSLSVKKSSNLVYSFYLYGIGYALTSLGCTLPIFSLMVVTALTSGDFLGGMTKFLVYSVGMGVVVTLISVAAMVSRQIVQKFINEVTPYLNQFAAILMMGSGVYVVIKWWPF